MQVEKPGSETPLWIRCPACGEYYYKVGQITCLGTYMKGSPSEADREAMNAELAGADNLLPGVIERIKDMQAPHQPIPLPLFPSASDREVTELILGN
jgi:hypothetical protein